MVCKYQNNIIQYLYISYTYLISFQHCLIYLSFYLYLYLLYAGKPIYSFDLRDESPANEGLLWANEVKEGNIKLRVFKDYAQKIFNDKRDIEK